jgi:hypothetical protein
LSERSRSSAAFLPDGTEFAVIRVSVVAFGEIMWLLLGAVIGAVVAGVIPHTARVIARLLSNRPRSPSTQRDRA